MPSVRGHVLNFLLRNVVRRRLTSLDLTLPNIHREREMLDRAGNSDRVPADFTIDRLAPGGIAAERIRPAGAVHATIFWLHGGAFVTGSPASHRPLLWRLAATAGVETIAIDYRLAPEHPFPAALDDAIAAWHGLDPESHARPLFIAGDSAGGGLALSLTAHLRALGHHLPSGVICLSPWTDLTGSGASMRYNADADPMLPAHRIGEVATLYAGDTDLEDERLSPAHGSFDGFPPMQVLVGSTEVLLDDANRVVSHARLAGVPVDYHIADTMPHVYPFFARWVPEARRDLNQIAAFIRRQLPQAAPAHAG